MPTPDEQDLLPDAAERLHRLQERLAEDLALLNLSLIHI